MDGDEESIFHSIVHIDFNLHDFNILSQVDDDKSQLDVGLLTDSQIDFDRYTKTNIMEQYLSFILVVLICIFASQRNVLFIQECDGKEYISY